MKIFKYLLYVSFIVLISACSEDIMDDINENRNDAEEMIMDNILPDMIVKSAYETTGTDIAWFTSIYVEQNAGTWGQASDADKRIGQNTASLFNNSWNSLYEVMNICKTVIRGTDPTTGSEPLNLGVRGVAQLLMAYNLAVTTDMWGECPYTQAFNGAEILQPAYDKQSALYVEIQDLLDDAIENFTNGGSVSGTDFIYGGDADAWIRAAYSLKARYYMRLSNRNTNAAANALAALANGFTSGADDMLFAEYQADLPNANPWGEYWYVRDHNSVSTTLYNILDTRNDPRLPYLANGDNPAPIGEAEQTQGGYSQSAISTGWDNFDANWTAPTPMMTYHELKFIEAEAQFRNGAAAATWQATLSEAIAAAFDYIGTHYYGGTIPGAAAYYTNEVVPRLTAGNELSES
ncbi:MAG: SusD/RagB family nutrient-binding outer membrane lipoprotein [Chloroflexia bacterium]|nr:SusD/RagB family nutrient-binding outer membrane lipoprotein [Chloroflexia bacterium]